MYVSAELAGRDTTLALTDEGQPRVDQVLKTVAQGSTVVAYQRLSGRSGASDIDVVDIYKIAKNQISEHARVSQAAARSER
jgi:predicted SnoaL-like aldol condensation-catalyzing enzyme